MQSSRHKMVEQVCKNVQVTCRRFMYTYTNTHVLMHICIYACIYKYKHTIFTFIICMFCVWISML